MDAISSLIEGPTRLIDHFWLAFNLGAQRTGNDIADYGARMRMGQRRFPRTVIDFDHGCFQVIAIQIGNSVENSTRARSFGPSLVPFESS